AHPDRTSSLERETDKLPRAYVQAATAGAGMAVARAMASLTLLLKSDHQVAGKARSSGTMAWRICSASASASRWVSAHTASSGARSCPARPEAGKGRGPGGWSCPILLQVARGRELLAGLAEPVADGAGRLSKG